MSTSGLFILALAISLASLPFAVNRFFDYIPLRSGKRLLIWIVESALMYVFLAIIAYRLVSHGGVKRSRRRRRDRHAREIRPSDRLSAAGRACSAHRRRADLKTGARGL
ncbi:DUF2818 family protein [Paraburkholderia edwinii]